MAYTTVFDASSSPFRHLDLGIPLILVGIGVLMVVFRRQLHRLPFGGLEPISTFLFLGIALFVLAVPATIVTVNNGNAGLALTRRECRVVQGRVENFHPMPANGHDTERFDLSGVRFSYSDFDLSTGGFNNTSSHGGPIREGLPIRVCERNGVILRLEVAR